MFYSTMSSSLNFFTFTSISFCFFTIFLFSSLLATFYGGWLSLLLFYFCMGTFDPYFSELYFETGTLYPVFWGYDILFLLSSFFEAADDFLRSALTSFFGSAGFWVLIYSLGFWLVALLLVSILYLSFSFSSWNYFWCFSLSSRSMSSLSPLRIIPSSSLVTVLAFFLCWSNISLPSS